LGSVVTLFLAMSWHATIYFRLWHIQDIADNRCLLFLLLLQGVHVLNLLHVDLHTNYEHAISVREAQEAICQVIFNELESSLRKSPCFAVIMDESTDVHVDQNLIIYVKFVNIDTGRAETHFYEVVKLNGAKAEDIFNSLIEAFRAKNLPLVTDKNPQTPPLVAVATDGAATMVGKKSGVVTRLRESVGLEHLISVHCIAHRLALASGKAADQVDYLVKYQEKVNGIYKYFEYSPKNMRNLEAIQNILSELNGDNPKGKRFRQVFATRWLSFEGAITALIENYSGLVSVFVEDGSAIRGHLNKLVHVHTCMTSSCTLLVCLHI